MLLMVLLVLVLKRLKLMKLILRNSKVELKLKIQIIFDRFEFFLKNFE